MIQEKYFSHLIFLTKLKITKNQANVIWILGDKDISIHAQINEIFV